MTRRLSLVALWGLLLVGTGLAFRAFDSRSHSASDTLRPFLLTMVPVWVVSVAAAKTILRRRD